MGLISQLTHKAAELASERCKTHPGSSSRETLISQSDLELLIERGMIEALKIKDKLTPSAARIDLDSKGMGH